MEIIILAFFTALGKVWVITRFLPVQKLVRHAKWFDLFFVFAVPIMFFGTFSGAILAVMSGLWFTFMTWLLGLFVK